MVGSLRLRVSVTPVSIPWVLHEALSINGSQQRLLYSSNALKCLLTFSFYIDFLSLLFSFSPVFWWHFFPPFSCFRSEWTKHWHLSMVGVFLCHAFKCFQQNNEQSEKSNQEWLIYVFVCLFLAFYQSQALCSEIYLTCFMITRLLRIPYQRKVEHSRKATLSFLETYFLPQ